MDNCVTSRVTANVEAKANQHYGAGVVSKIS